MKKASMELHIMWHIDALMHIFPVTIVTTVDNLGKINAAPYSLVLPFCSSPKNPQMLLIVNKAWHTAKNIEATGEFVLNYPTADQIKDIVETSKFHPAGINEMDYTRYTTMPSNFVCPPRIVECYQHVECRVKETVKPSRTQLNFIADVLDISLDADLYEISRLERAKRIKAPVYFGIDITQQHIFGKVEEMILCPFD